MNIVITGASSGIGFALYEAFIVGGHTVAGCSRHPLTGQHYCDVSSHVDIKGFASEVGRAMPHVDALINCAGVLGDIGETLDTAPSTWWRAFETNVKGSYLTAHVFRAALLNAQAPRIINFIGGGSHSSFPYYSGYAASKAAIVRLTECMADEYRGKIRVNAVAPGGLATPIHQKTIDAGVERAGAAQYAKTLDIIEGRGDASMLRVVTLIKRLLAPEADNVTGRCLRAQAADPFAAIPAAREIPALYVAAGD